MRRAMVINVKEDEAIVLFADLNIQKNASILKGVEVNAGDIALIGFEDKSSRCIVIGVVK